MITHNSDIDTLEIPTNYTFQNKLIYLAIHEVLKPYIHESWTENTIITLKQELSGRLIETFKLPFTKIEVTKNGNEIKGHIEYTGGNPLEFILSNKHNEN
jgi:hypothetical protein